MFTHAIHEKVQQFYFDNVHYCIQLVVAHSVEELYVVSFFNHGPKEQQKVGFKLLECYFFSLVP